MFTQWDCLLKNLGEWRGSFTRLSPTGEMIEDIPSVVSLEGLEDNTRIHQVVRRFYPDQPPQDLVLDYRSLNRSILFFESGAFSQGAMQWGAFAEFGAEFGLIEQQRRLRIVILYNQDQLNKITLIREKLAEADEPERPALTVGQLIGVWVGEAITIYPDLRSPNRSVTHLSVERQGSDRIYQELTFGQGTTIRSGARVDGNRLLFEASELPVQILLLPDGASANAPLLIKPNHRFVLEMGWLLSPTRRERIIRSYSEKGEWVSSTLVTEEKVS